MNIINYTEDFVLSEDEILILKYILEMNTIPQNAKGILFGCNQKENYYQIIQDTGNLVDFCKNNTRYTTLEEITDILIMIELKTKYFRIAGNIENGSPINLNISTIGAVKLFSEIQHDTIDAIMLRLDELYHGSNGIIRLATTPFGDNVKAFKTFYEENQQEFAIPFEIFKLVFFGLKELGYISGLGNFTALQSSDLRLSGLGLRYVKDLKAEKTKKEEIVGE